MTKAILCPANGSPDVLRLTDVDKPVPPHQVLVRVCAAAANLADYHMMRGGIARVIGWLIEAGTVVPIIDRCYPLAQTADAIRYLEMGHARGKVVVQLL